MARLPDIRVRDVSPPPHDEVPRVAWVDVVRQLGDLVLVHVKGSSGGTKGQLRIEYEIDYETVRKVRALLIGYSSEPWAVDAEGPWSADADAWKQ